MLDPHHAEHHQLIPLIKNCALFAEMSLHELRGLSHFFEKITLSVGDTLFRQGDSAESVYILTSGKLVGLLEMEDEDKVVEIINSVEAVGELEVISQEPRALTLKAATDATLLKFPGEKFVRLYHKNQQMTLEVMKIISRRSMETIKLMSRKKRYPFIVIFGAHKDLSLESFTHKIKKNMVGYPLIFMPEDIVQPDNMLQLIQQQAEQQTSHHISFIKNYQPQLFDFFAEQDTHFFLLTEGGATNEMDASAQEILDHIKSKKLRLSLILLQNDDQPQPLKTQFWLDKADFHLHHHIKLNDDASYARFIRFAIGKANALVLSGGGMRGYAHLGVIRALTESGVPIDIIGGTSVGASISAYYAGHPDYQQVLKMSDLGATAVQSSFFIRNLTWPIISIFNGHPATQLSIDTFAQTRIEDLWLPFFSISANISTSTETIHRKGLVWEAVRSSNAIPGLLPPVVINGQLHCDGGLLNNLPVDVMRNLVGPGGKIIASQVSRLIKDKNHYAFPPTFSLKEAMLYKLGLRGNKYKVPHFMETFFKSLLLGASEREQKNSLAADLLIHHDISHYPTYKIKKPEGQKLIEIGYQDTIKRLEKNIIA